MRKMYEWWVARFAFHPRVNMDLSDGVIMSVTVATPFVFLAVFLPVIILALLPVFALVAAWWRLWFRIINFMVS